MKILLKKMITMVLSIIMIASIYAFPMFAAESTGDYEVKYDVTKDGKNTYYDSIIEDSDEDELSTCMVSVTKGNILCRMTISDDNSTMGKAMTAYKKGAAYYLSAQIKVEDKGGVSKSKVAIKKNQREAVSDAVYSYRTKKTYYGYHKWQINKTSERKSYTFVKKIS